MTSLVRKHCFLTDTQVSVGKNRHGFKLSPYLRRHRRTILLRALEASDRARGDAADIPSRSRGGDPRSIAVYPFSQPFFSRRFLSARSTTSPDGTILNTPSPSGSQP